MPKRSVELDEEAAHCGIEERGARRTCEVARELVRAGIVAAMRVEEAAREQRAEARRQAVAAMLAAQDEIIAAGESHCLTRWKGSSSSRSLLERCSTSKRRTGYSSATARA